MKSNSLVLALFVTFGSFSSAFAASLAEGAKAIPSNVPIIVGGNVSPFAPKVVSADSGVEFVRFDKTVDMFEVVHTVCNLKKPVNGVGSVLTCTSK